MEGIVCARRTASVIISGSSNLPPEKLLCLSSSINKILQLIVDIYNACEDSAMQPQEKFNKISDARALDRDIDQLIYCLGEEMNICTENIRNGMKAKYLEVSQNGKELKYLITQYSEDSSFRFQTAKAIFEGMLQLVNDSIDLLKMADQHFVERLVNEANITLIYLKKVREAATINELVIAAQDYTTAFVNLAKRLSKRIDSGVLFAEQKNSASQAFAILRNESSNVVNVKRNQLAFPGNEMHAIALGSTVKTIVAAVKTVFEVARAEPNFSVDFQVDYVNDEFGLLLTELVNAVERCDQNHVVSLLEQIVRAVSNRIIETGMNHVDPKIQKVSNDLIEARHSTYQCLSVKQNMENTMVVIEAGKMLDTSLKQLRESYHSLSNQLPIDRTSLRKAAHQIIANLDKLVKV